MASRNKLQKFAELLTLPNVYENFDMRHPGLTGKDGIPVALKDRWRSDHFGNSAPLTLELACGRGEYTVELARRYPGRNFIGVDVKGARIWKGARIALAEELRNAAFLRTRIEQVDLFFGTGEVDEIWITFPDPFLKKGKENRRLTSPAFLDRYRNILKPGRPVHLKTDSREMYEFTLKVIAADPRLEVVYHDDDIYNKPLPTPELDIETYYERMHKDIGKTITYIQFRLGERGDI